MAALMLAVFGVGVYAVAQGSYDIALRDILSVLFGGGRGTSRVVIASIRLPRVAAAVVCGAGLADRVQRTLGIPVVVLDYGAFATFDEAVYDALRIAGKILNRKKRADEVVDYIESLRKDLARRTLGVPDDEKPLVYVGGIGYRGAHGIKSTEQHYIPFEWVGAKTWLKRSNPP
ncbi:MAG: iron chelate uptake ABC transporter family permease subunit [Deltaproteobacteria bacterium]|nr:iron chelate uptake ABC transporter family permease subunit [Deltaproteobacteria bacterium]